MSIDDDWNDMNKQTDDELSRLLNNPRLSAINSTNPLVKIKRSLVINMWWGGVICAGYVVIMIIFPLWQILLTISVVLLFSIWTFFTAWKQFKNINVNVSPGNSLVEELKRQHDSILIWMETQKRVALFIYPVSGAGGFMLGGMLGSGKTIEYFFSKPIVFPAMILVLILLVPAAHFLAKRLFKASFGKHLLALKKNITELEEINL